MANNINKQGVWTMTPIEWDGNVKVFNNINNVSNTNLVNNPQDISIRSQYAEYPTLAIQTLTQNQNYTISFDAKSLNGLGTFYCSLSNNGSSVLYFQTQIKPLKEYTHYSFTIAYGTQTVNRVLFAAYKGWSNNADVDDTIYITNIKLEQGDASTPFIMEDYSYTNPVEAEGFYEF